MEPCVEALVDARNEAMYRLSSMGVAKEDVKAVTGESYCQVCRLYVLMYLCSYVCLWCENE